MGKKYTEEEIIEVVKGVEGYYEKILQDDLVKAYYRFRVRSYYYAFNTLKETGLSLFNEEGKISRKELIGMEVGNQLRTVLYDELGAIYFLPVESEELLGELLDGEYIIERLLYYYCGKNKMDRTIFIKKLLSDYRQKFRQSNS